MFEGVHEIRRHEADSGITTLDPALDGLAIAKRQAVGRGSFSPLSFWTLDSQLANNHLDSTSSPDIANT